MMGRHDPTHDGEAVMNGAPSRIKENVDCGKRVGLPPENVSQCLHVSVDTAVGFVTCPPGRSRAFWT